MHQEYIHNQLYIYLMNLSFWQKEIEIHLDSKVIFTILYIALFLILPHNWWELGNAKNTLTKNIVNQW